MESDEIACEGHVTGRAGVGGVGVVQEGRGKESGEIDDEPDAREDEERGGSAWGTDSWCD